MLYIGYHKGSVDDGYISSSKTFNEAYHGRPKDFTRQIIAEGCVKDMQSLEITLLKNVDAARNGQFYNKHNGGKNFVCNGHSIETRAKMSKSRTGKPANVTGKRWTYETLPDHYKRPKSETHKKNMALAKMGDANPMKNKESVAKMLASRKRNKEAKYGPTR